MKRSIFWILIFGLSLVSLAHGQTTANAAVKGSGTPNFVPIWTSDRSIGNSVLFQDPNSKNVGVGTNHPMASLDVEGNQFAGVSSLLSNTTPFARAIGGIALSNTQNAYGVAGENDSTTGAGMIGTAESDTGDGVGGFFQARGDAGTGVWGYASSGSGYTIGVAAQVESPNGAAGRFTSHSGSGLILQGTSGSNFTQVFYVDGSGNGYFAGNLNVTGNLSKGSGSFKIDHPLDPANKYLSHSFVESPDMTDVYNGIVVLDVHGSAWVELPDYFQALNGDYRYQLTAIGAPGPNLYIAKEISGNRFKISGGKPSGKVSWQVTGIRQDAYANAHRIAVEEDKPAEVRGHYLHPELFGAPREQAIGAVHRQLVQPVLNGHNGNDTLGLAPN